MSTPITPKGSSRYVDGVLVTELVGPDPKLTDTDDYIVRRDNWAAVSRALAPRSDSQISALLRMGERYLRKGEI